MAASTLVDALYLLGALFIGGYHRFFAAVAVAVVQLAALALWMTSTLGGDGRPVVGFLLYCASVACGWVIYWRGKALSEDHDHRETSELLGASSFIGSMAVVGSVATTLLG